MRIRISGGSSIKALAAGGDFLAVICGAATLGGGGGWWMRRFRRDGSTAKHGGCGEVDFIFLIFFLRFFNQNRCSD